MVPLQKVYYYIDLAKASASILPVPLQNGQEAFITLRSQTRSYEKSFFYDPSQQNSLEVIRGADTYNLTVYVYGEDALIGGYIGVLDVGADMLARKPALTIHAYEELPHPKDAEAVTELYSYLKESTDYHTHYGPRWIG
jgi:hypothetical protein